MVESSVWVGWTYNAIEKKRSCPPPLHAKATLVTWILNIERWKSLAHHIYSVKNVGVLVNGMTPSQENEQSLSSLSEMLTDLQYFIMVNNHILSETTGFESLV